MREPPEQPDPLDNDGHDDAGAIDLSRGEQPTGTKPVWSGCDGV